MVSPPSTSPTPISILFPRSTQPPFPLQKIACFPERTFNLNKKGYIWLCESPHVKAGQQEKKKSQEQTKVSGTQPLPLFGVSQNHEAMSNNICVTDVMHTHDRLPCCSEPKLTLFSLFRGLCSNVLHSFWILQSSLYFQNLKES